MLHPPVLYQVVSPPYAIPECEDVLNASSICIFLGDG